MNVALSRCSCHEHPREPSQTSRTLRLAFQWLPLRNVIIFVNPNSPSSRMEGMTRECRLNKLEA
jgi:hypothetical protein